MLAFTMQFSRYGRNRSVLGTPSGVPFGWAVRGKRPNEATASSGPNSVLGALSVACPRSVAPVKENVLTEQSQESEPNEYSNFNPLKRGSLPVTVKLECS
jgi:hypothetical protein